MIIFQPWLGKMISKVAITKTKSSQREINKKKKTLKRSIFQDLSFIGSLCKVIGALGFSCITLLIYAPKSSKSNFVLNHLKLDDLMFSTKTLCQCFQLKPCINVFQTCLKGFKLKMMFVEPKTAQLVEPDEELVD